MLYAVAREVLCMVSYTVLLQRLRAQLHINGHLVGVAAGSGMTGTYAMMGGADFLLALSSGRYRIMGRGSYAGYYCYGSSNDITPMRRKVPPFRAGDIRRVRRICASI